MKKLCDSQLINFPCHLLLPDVSRSEFLMQSFVNMGQLLW